MDPEPLFDHLQSRYESAYADNPTLQSYIQSTIALLPPGGHVLDVGCGTGVPVARTLSTAGFRVTGIDISAGMLSHAQTNVPSATFVKTDMRTYTPSPPEAPYDAVFIIFSHLQLTAAEVRGVVEKYASALREGGVLVLASVPAEKYVDDAALEAEPGSGAYVEGLEAPFMGFMIRATLFSTEGLVALVRGCGLEVVKWDNVTFQPKEEGLVPEEQVFILARRTGGEGR